MVGGSLNSPHAHALQSMIFMSNLLFSSTRGCQAKLTSLCHMLIFMYSPRRMYYYGKPHII